MRTTLPLLAAAALLSLPLAAASPDDEPPAISVQDEGGAFVVEAQFCVEAPPAVVRDVLTDYEAIVRFMPGVRVSRVLERGDGFARVEQEAESRYLLFSRRVHLLLDVHEARDTIHFRDRSGQSFTHYEGSWMIDGRQDGTEIAYSLTATPAFSVPGFVLRRLLDRDARAMVDGLRAEVAARERARP